MQLKGFQIPLCTNQNSYYTVTANTQICIHNHGQSALGLHSADITFPPPPTYTCARTSSQTVSFPNKQHSPFLTDVLRECQIQANILNQWCASISGKKESRQTSVNPKKVCMGMHWYTVVCTDSEAVSIFFPWQAGDLLPPPLPQLALII